MKKLSEYKPSEVYDKLFEQVYESRQLLGTLPFNIEEFRLFMKHAILDGDYEESEYWDDIKDKVTDYMKQRHITFGSSSYNRFLSFVGWCESYFSLREHFDMSIDDFYKLMSRIPLSRVNNVMGAGSEGIVIALNRDKVIKVFYDIEIPKSIKPFIDLCYSTKESNVLPKIYKIGKNWCIMERLKINTPACRELMKCFDWSYKFQGKHLENWVTEEPSQLPFEFTPAIKKAYEWGLMCKHEFEKAKSSYVKWPGDLNLKNIGERKNGDIIYFDI